MTPGLDAIAQLQRGFVAGANLKTLGQLQHHCRVLLDSIQQFIDDIAVNEAGAVDWLEFSGLQYDLSIFATQADLDNFTEIQKQAFQEDIDNSTMKGFRIATFGFVAIAGSNPLRHRPSAFLSPKAVSGGGSGGTVNPGYPPK